MRIRSIKPEFWRSQAVANLPRDIRLLWIGLWSYVDDNGVGVDDYRQIAADLFALDDDPHEAREFVRDGLATLSRGFRITRYVSDGRPLLYVNGWGEHQRVDKPHKERFPEPTDEDKRLSRRNDGAAIGIATPSRESRETLAPGTGEQGNRGTGEERTSEADAPDTPSTRPDVDRLCERMLERLHDNGVKANITNAWRDDARRLLDRDGRDLEQALRLIDWTANDHFWSMNVHSIPKFRKQYDLLRMHSERDERPPLRAVSGGHVTFQNPKDPETAYREW